MNDKRKSILDNVTGVDKLKFCFYTILIVTFFVAVSIFMQDTHKSSIKTYEVSELYKVSIPSQYDRFFVNDSTVFLDGEMDDFDSLVVVMPRKIPNGILIPLDRNIDFLASMLKETLDFVNIKYGEVKISEVATMEFSLRNAIMCDCSFDNYQGEVYLFMAEEYLFLIVCLERANDNPTFFQKHTHRLAFLQLCDDYRFPLLERHIIDSSDMDFNYSEVVKAKDKLETMRRIYNNSELDINTLTTLISDFRKCFSIFSQQDVANMISESDYQIFLDANARRDTMLEKLKNSVIIEFSKGDYAAALNKINELEKQANLSYDFKWHQWIKSNKIEITKRLK